MPMWKHTSILLENNKDRRHDKFQMSICMTKPPYVLFLANRPIFITVGGLFFCLFPTKQKENTIYVGSVNYSM